MWRSVRIKDSSGGVVVAGVRGDVEIDDSSGEIELRVVEGFVAVSDSSSEIAASGIAGSVIVHRDSSGPIRVTDLSGDFFAGGATGARSKLLVSGINI